MFLQSWLIPMPLQGLSSITPLSNSRTVSLSHSNRLHFPVRPVNTQSAGSASPHLWGTWKKQKTVQWNYLCLHGIPVPSVSALCISHFKHKATQLSSATMTYSLNSWLMLAERQINTLVISDVATETCEAGGPAVDVWREAFETATRLFLQVVGWATGRSRQSSTSPRFSSVSTRFVLPYW